MTHMPRHLTKGRKNPRYENCSHFWENVRFGGSKSFDLGVEKCRKISLKYLPVYRKYTESESDIQNNNLFYKTDQTCQNTFEVWENMTFSKISKQYFIISINSIIHIL